MTLTLRSTLIPAALAAGLSLAAGSAQAIGQGDWLVRGGIAHVSPDDESSTIEPSFGAGSGVSVDSATSVGITIVKMITNNVGVELVGALPFKHDIKGDGNLSALGKVAETKQLPPTLLAQYYFNPSSNVRPYVGLGINYTTFFSEKTTGALAGNSISLDDSWGLAAEIGVDVDINNEWFFNAALWNIDIDTTATIGNVPDKVNVNIDPWVFLVGVGKKF